MKKYGDRREIYEQLIFVFVSITHLMRSHSVHGSPPLTALQSNPSKYHAEDIKNRESLL